MTTSQNRPETLCAASNQRYTTWARRCPTVIRTRMFVTDISQWRTVGAVHAEFFGEIRPAATMVEVAALIEPHLLVEVEADAYVASGNSGNRPSGPGG